MSNNPGYALNKAGRGPVPDHNHEPQATRLDRARARREAADERTHVRAARTDQEQLAILIERGHPNCREALRLAAKIGDGQ